jgi:hypothetical protein
MRVPFSYLLRFSGAPFKCRAPPESLSVRANESFFMRHLFLLAVACLVLSLPAMALDFTVSGQGLPPSVASPTSDQGKALTSSLKVSLLVIVNTGSVSQTVTVNDCQGTPFYLFKATPIPALTTWTVSTPAGMPFAGCLKWAASSTTVMGTITGAQ